MLVNGCSFSFCKIKNSSDLLHNNLNTVKATLHLKMVKIVNVRLYVYTIKKISPESSDK